MVLSYKNSLIFYKKTRFIFINICRLIVRYGGEQQNYLDEVKKTALVLTKAVLGLNANQGQAMKTDENSASRSEIHCF